MAAALTLSGAVITIPGKVLASESVHLSEDGEGGLFVNMPRYDQLDLDVSDREAGFSFHVYDDGGKDANASVPGYGYLQITAQTDLLIQIEGVATGVPGEGGILKVHDGPAIADGYIYDNSDGYGLPDGEDVGTLYSSGSNVLLELGNNGYGEANLDITVTLVDRYSVDYPITYDLDGGALPEGKTNPETYREQSEDITLVNPQREGYIFTGWTGKDIYTPQKTVVIETGHMGPLSFKANWQEIPEDACVRLTGHSLKLDGYIGVNFHLNFSNMIYAYPDAYMQFTMPNGIVSKVYLQQKDGEEREVAAYSYADSVNYRVFTCKVSAKEMADTITAEMFFDEETPGPTYTYSVKEYADYLLEHADEKEEYRKAAPLVRSMLNYGTYAQVYFKHNTANPANADSVTVEQIRAIEAVDVYKINKPYSTSDYNLPENLKLYGLALSLESGTTMKLYMYNGTGKDVTYTYKGETLETETDDMYTVVKVENLAANELDNVKVDVSVSGDSGQYSISSCPLNYCHTVLSRRRSESIQNLMRALYMYHAVAKDYFEE